MAFVLKGQWEEVPVSINERLRRCEELVETEPHTGHAVVWLARGDADLEGHHGTTVGPVTFYWGTWLKHIAQDGNWSRPGVPEDLKRLADYEQRLFLSHMPSVDNFVLARVDLGAGGVEDAIQQADYLLNSVVS